MRSILAWSVRSVSRTISSDTVAPPTYRGVPAGRPRRRPQQEATGRRCLDGVPPFDSPHAPASPRSPLTSPNKKDDPTSREPWITRRGPLTVGVEGTGGTPQTPV